MPGIELPPAKLDDYFIDRYEVTNKEFKRFVDAGGYRDRRYWTEKFVDRGRVLSWEEAMTRFRDKTGRPGPSTWELGDYLEGQADYPVTGVSWYEAAAYAVFVGQESSHLIPLGSGRGGMGDISSGTAEQFLRSWTCASRIVQGDWALRHVRHGRQYEGVVLERKRRKTLHRGWGMERTRLHVRRS